MPPKRKDASRKVFAPIKASPAPVTQAKPAADPAEVARLAQIRTARKRLIRNLFRLFMAGTVLLWMWPKIFPGEEVDLTAVTEQEEPVFEEILVDVEKRSAVLAAFKDSWAAYEREAFGFDDYHPISHKGSNMSPQGPVGYFVIDALDSLLLLGQHAEFQRVREWVKDLSFDVDDKFHTFEITIRVLGGLLSAYHLSGNDSVFLDKAVNLADRLLPAFDSPSGLPYSFVNLKTRTAIPDADNRGMISVAEAGTLQLELKYLSELTGNPIYWQKAEKVIDIIREQPGKDGLVPIFLSPDTGRFMLSEIRLGSRGDSYYEYLSKMYLQTNRTEPVYKDMHIQAMSGIKKHLLKASVIKRVMYTSEFIPRRDPKTGALNMMAVPKQDHLVCFLPGSLLLGITDGRGPAPIRKESFTEDWQADDFHVAKALIRGCVDTYESSITGLAPEIVNYFTESSKSLQHGRDWFINSRLPAPKSASAPKPSPPIDARNILRPETVENLFVAYRLTGNPQYREWGWSIFQSFVKHCRLPANGAFAGIRDVDEVPVVHEDRMETFWLSETLKYLYLLFSGPDLLPLDQYVFNTEAHPLPVFTPTVVRAQVLT